MDKKQSLRVFLFTSYSSAAYEVLHRLIESGTDLKGVLFAPTKTKRLPFRTMLKSVFSLKGIQDPARLLTDHGIPFTFTDDPNEENVAELLKVAETDVLLLYGAKIIKPHILAIPKIGTLNSHSALLPKYRGGSSEFWILYYNEPQYAGVTIHWVVPSLDAGDIFLQKPIAVEAHDTPLMLRQKSVPVTAELFVTALAQIADGRAVHVAQDWSQSTTYRWPNKDQIARFNKRLRARKAGVEHAISSAILWFLSSGIQNPVRTHIADGHDLSGSFNAWFDPECDQYSYIYLEISGYALTTLLFLYEQKKESIFLERAILVGEWLVRVQNENGAFPTALYRAERSFQKPEEFHTFDVGMIFNGFIVLYRLTKKERFLAAAKRAADWVIFYQKPDGSVVAQINKDTGAVQDSDRTWSTQSGPYHAKLAIGLLNIFDATGEEKYKKAAIQLCDYALTQLQDTGQFLTYGALQGTNLHPHLYAAEGLYVAGEYLKNEVYTGASKLATAWALSHMKAGLVPRHKHGDTYNYNERVDILAQSLRLAVLHEVHPTDINMLVETIASYQYFGEKKDQYGGFEFGKMSDGAPARHINSWVTMFALQALMLHSGRKLASPFYLI